MTNETFSRNRHIYLGLSIFGHILKEFMEIFQDGAFPDLEYHLFQLIWCFSALIRNFTVTNDTYSGNRRIYVGA